MGWNPVKEAKRGYDNLTGGKVVSTKDVVTFFPYAGTFTTKGREELLKSPYAKAATQLGGAYLQGGGAGAVAAAATGQSGSSWGFLNDLLRSYLPEPEISGGGGGGSSAGGEWTGQPTAARSSSGLVVGLIAGAVGLVVLLVVAFKGRR